MVGNICYYFYSLQTSAVHTYTYIYTRTHPARTIPEIMYNNWITPKITQLNNLSVSLTTRDSPLSFEDFQFDLLSNELLLDGHFKTIPPIIYVSTTSNCWWKSTCVDNFNYSWTLIAFSIESHALTPLNKMELPKGNIDVSLKWVCHF